MSLETVCFMAIETALVAAWTIATCFGNLALAAVAAVVLVALVCGYELGKKDGAK